jgi:hypothetical protein
MGWQIDREAQQRHGDKSADNGHRHGRCRYQDSTPILQEDQDNDQHQHTGFEEGFVYFVDRRINKQGGIQRDFMRLASPATTPPATWG